MTATDELRKLLDERGVEWKSGNFIQPDAETQWGNNRYTDYPELLPFLTMSNCTPEQAIAATLGTPERTCRIEERYIDWYCDACFEMVGTCDTTSELFIDGNAIKLWNYCPNCGAKVVEVGNECN